MVAKKIIAVLCALALLGGVIFFWRNSATAAGDPKASFVNSTVAKGGYAVVKVSDLSIPRRADGNFCNIYQEVFSDSGGKRVWFGSTEKPVFEWSYLVTSETATYDGMKLRIRVSCDGSTADLDRVVSLGSLQVVSSPNISLSATSLQTNQTYELRLVNYAPAESVEIKVASSDGKDFPALNQKIVTNPSGSGSAQFKTTGLPTGAYVIEAKGLDSGLRSLTFDIAGGVAQPVNIPVSRIYGKSAVDTAVAISKSSNWSSGKTVYLVNELGFQDALAAGPAAFAEEGPILLVGRDTLYPQTWAELLRLKPAKVRLLGGSFAISPAVENQLRTQLANALKPAPEIVRIKGTTAEQTAIEISKATFQTAATVFLATSQDYPDALAAGPLAAQLKVPVLLTGSGLWSGIVPELKRLGVKKLYLLGGGRAIPGAIETQLKKAGFSVTRLAGASALETAYVVNATVANEKQYSTVYWATSLGFADGLAAAPMIAKEGGVLMLSGSGCVDPISRVHVLRQGPARMVLVGGAVAVPDAVGRLKTCS